MIPKAVSSNVKNGHWASEDSCKKNATMKRHELNLRDLGGIPFANGKGTVPHGLYLRSGKLSILTKEECANLCTECRIACVIDLRTSVESAEYPDPLSGNVEYLQIPLLKDSTIGITHETGSDPMIVVRNLRKHPEKLKEMIPDIKALYAFTVTDEFSRGQLEKVVSKLRENGERGICTLFHCTAGKDRTGIVSMALLMSYGVSDKEIIQDYLRTNRNALWPTLKKCMGVGLMTWNWSLVKIAFKAFMADRTLIETAIENYKKDEE